jgi:hypothetical protein
MYSIVCLSKSERHNSLKRKKKKEGRREEEYIETDNIV